MMLRGYFQSVAHQLLVKHHAHGWAHNLMHGVTLEPRHDINNPERNLSGLGGQLRDFDMEE
jgi:hypothetical protein